MRLIDQYGSLWLSPPRRRAGGGSLPTNLPPVTVTDSATVFAGASVVIDVLANDLDPEGGALTLVSAAAQNGTAVVTTGGDLRYTPATGFTGSDEVTYVAADPAGATASGSVTVTVVEPAVSITANADGTLTVDAATGQVTITVTSPAEFAGTYVTDTTLLAGGPVNLAVPQIEGTLAEGGTLSAIPGLWLVGEPVIGEAWEWLRDGDVIPGASGPTYVVAEADLGRLVAVVETVTDVSGSRSAESPALPVPSAFAPVDDAGVLAWYDSTDAATITTTAGGVSQWASKAGAGSLVSSSASEQPETGMRTIGGRNVLDFSGSDRMTGTVTLPSGGDVAVHALIAIDSLTNSFAAVLAMDATNDFQLDANATGQFDGRLSVTGIGSNVVLSGGPYSGPIVLSLIFDRTGTGTFQIFVDGLLRGSGSYSAPLDAVQTLMLMTNRSRNAFIDGAVGEVIVTGTVSNRNDYHAYLTTKWVIV